MCNYISIGIDIKKLFQYFLLFYLIKLNNPKSVKKYDECNKFLDVKDCYYFPCLDAHYSCGRDNHLARFSYDLCLLSTKKYTSQLTQNARFYFNHTNTCAMISLDDQLIEESITGRFSCTDLQKLIFDVYLNCFQNYQRKNQVMKVIDFCSIICENLQTMIDLFINLRDAYINLHELLKETGKTCGANIDYSTTHTIPSLLIGICLDRKNVRLEQDITNIMFNQRYEPNDYEWI
jgi:hypothetical protein